MVLFLELLSNLSILLDLHRKVEKEAFLYERNRSKWRKDISLTFQFQVDIPTVAALLELELEGLFLIDEKSDLWGFDMLEDLELPGILDGLRFGHSQLQSLSLKLSPPLADVLSHGEEEEDGGQVVEDELNLIDQLAFPVLEGSPHPLDVLDHKAEEFLVVERVELHIVDPPRKSGVLLANPNPQTHLELAVSVLYQEHLLLRAEPILPIALVNRLGLQELEFELSEEAPLGELRHEGLSAHGMDAVGEVFIGV